MPRTYIILLAGKQKYPSNQTIMSSNYPALKFKKPIFFKKPKRKRTNPKRSIFLLKSIFVDILITID